LEKGISGGLHNTCTTKASLQVASVMSGRVNKSHLFIEARKLSLGLLVEVLPFFVEQLVIIRMLKSELRVGMGD